jgi:hypothetical protein
MTGKSPRFEILCFSTTRQMKLMRETDTREVRICDERGWFKGVPIEKAEPNLIRLTFPGVDKILDLRLTEHRV